jgi:hypothetical protein
LVSDMAVAALTAVHVIAVISELVAPALQDGEPVARVKANAERARERLRMVASERGVRSSDERPCSM